MQAMLGGDFERAWRVSDGVLAQRLSAKEPCWNVPRHMQWVWRGEPLAGKRVLVRCYHGLGDTLQFVRFAAPLRAAASDVAVWVQPELLSLVASVPGVDRVLPLHDGDPGVAYDVDIEVMELPHALRVTLGTLPGRVPYVFPRQAPARFPRDGRSLVGIVWRAGNWDPRRTIPPGLMARLGAVPGVELVSLQRGHSPQELGETGARDLSSGDGEAAAQIIRELDLVVSVDTMVAHLAGALGAPVWTLLHSDADWRWMRGREDSPWYPTMRLFRQRRPGDWSGVIDEVAAALANGFC